MDDDLRIPISISARHLHLSQDHVEALFGVGHQLTPLKDLSQPGQFACEERVDLVGPTGRIEGVRVLGPARKLTQVEISRTDERRLGIDAPIRGSGNIAGSEGLKLEGTAGSVTLHEGVIQAQRHVHMHPTDADRFGVKDGDWVMVRVGGPRGLIYDDVLVRVSDSYQLDMHVDTDEANAADLQPGATGELIKVPTAVAPDPDD